MIILSILFLAFENILNVIQQQTYINLIRFTQIIHERLIMGGLNH